MVPVEFDRFSLRIGGERRLIRSGSLPYFRLPDPGLWRDRLEKMRAAGLNAVDLSYPWSFHSESAGDYDFSGTRDLYALHDMVEEAGLLLIARPGPYICADLDMGGLPAWLLRDRSYLLRCRSQTGFNYSREFIAATREWFEHVIPTFAGRPGLILMQIENEYTVPGPLSALPQDLIDLLIRWFGTDGLGARLRPLARIPWLRAWVEWGWLPRDAMDRGRGQTSPYMQELYEMARDLGVEVPIFHNDLWPHRDRQMDVDILGLDRHPITDCSRDWRRDPRAFDAFSGDEQALAAIRLENPVFYPELQGGRTDGWGGVGYERIRDVLGPDSIDGTTKAALLARATLWSYSVFCGGVSWGYMASPAVYSSYDLGAPVAESGRLGARYQAVRRLNEFLERFEADLCETHPLEDARWCPEHLLTRQGPRRRFVFLRNPSCSPIAVPTPEAERSQLEAWETQIRVYGEDGTLEAISPASFRGPDSPPDTPPPLPRLERWTFSGTSPQLDPTYDDSAWTEIPEDLALHGRIDIDSLGVHYGFIWYRGSFHQPIDRLLLDARHCYSVWLNRECVAAGDQFQNVLGVGPDGARLRRIRLERSKMVDGRNVLVILVESLGHNKGLADDAANPRGIVRIDTGPAPIAWRYRGGLVRGERGMTPVVAFDGVDRSASQEVVLPHGWSGDPEGVALYETSFRLDGIDPEATALAASFDPGRGKANLYLNGVLIGRYWPERGPQRKFVLPWGVLRPEGENELAITVWKRGERAALGKVRLELA